MVGRPSEVWGWTADEPLEHDHIIPMTHQLPKEVSGKTCRSYAKNLFTIIYAVIAGLALDFLFLISATCFTVIYINTLVHLMTKCSFGVEVSTIV